MKLSARGKTFGKAAKKARKTTWTQRILRHSRLRKRHLASFDFAGVKLPTTRFAASSEVRTDLEIHLLREASGITYLYNDTTFTLQKYKHYQIAPAYLYWFSQSCPTVERISCDLSDGEWPGFAQFTFSTCFTGKVLLPDQHFFRDRGYEAVDRVADNAPAWEKRGETVYWRGLNNNLGLFSLEAEHMGNPWVMQRVRLVMKAREIAGIDARFVQGSGQRQEAQCAEAGLIGPKRPWQEWSGDKYALDIDGFTNAWSNLMQRLRLGCCVLKVESQHGFRQWYYDKLVPFETYVPVRADLSDLAEKIEWVRTHDREAQEIAANGQAFALAMTFETETRNAARIIEENWA